MRLRETRRVVVTLPLLLGLLAGCPGGGGPSISNNDFVSDRVDADLAPDGFPDGADVPPDLADAPDAWDGADGHDAVDVPDGADLPDTADAPDEADTPDVPPPPAPVLAFHFWTASGAKGEGEASVSLTLADEPPAYAGTPGFQVDVVVRTEHLEDGQDVTLEVAGQVVATLPVVVDAGTGLGEVVFQAVTLTHNPVGYEVVVRAVNLAGLSGSDAKTVLVDIGACGVTLLPANTACLLDDTDPDAPGVQATFTVKNPDRTCDTATLRYAVAGGEVRVAGPVSLNGTGSAQFTVTLVDDPAQADGVDVVVIAEVTDSQAPQRTGATPDLAYTLDLVDPVLALVKPDKASYTLADDKDGDPGNGLTLDIQGTAEGIEPGSTVSLTLNDNALAEVAPDEQGGFAYEDLHLTEDGAYTVAAVGRDACGREGRAAASFQAKVSLAAYSFVFPPQGGTLLAKDDQNPATTTKYETTFQVQGADVTPGATLTVRCRRDAVGSVSVTVGSVVIPDASGTYDIPVTLDVQVLTQQVRCQVRDDASNPGSSGEVAFRVGLPPPVLKILSPVAGQFIEKPQVAVKAFAAGLAGVLPVVQVRDGSGGVVLDFPSGPIQATGLSFTLPLQVGGGPIPDGAYTLVVNATDQYGNVASDIVGNVTQVPFTLDTTAPEVAIVQPDHDTIDPALNPGDADEDPATPGHQVTVIVRVLSGGGAGTTVCLRVNAQPDRCATQGGDPDVVFTGVTLIAGPNAVRAWAVDAAKNQGATQERTLTLVTGAPRVVIVQPDKDGPVAVLPFDLVVEVTDSALTPLAGVPVTLFINDIEGETKDTNDLGRATFQVATLSETGDRFVARAVSAGGEGYSLPRTLYLKTTVPALAFVVPQDGEFLNLGHAACAPGIQDCVLDVVLDAPNFETGSSGTLTVQCGTASPATLPGLVEAGQIVFPDVTLADQKKCKLQAAATDVGGLGASAGPITVTVDRIAPDLFFDRPTPGANSLTSASDEDPATPGLQYTLVVRYTGIAKDLPITVTYGLLGDAPQTMTLPAPKTAAPDGQYVSLILPQVTLPNGTVVLGASTTDTAGNPATTERILSVWADQPVLGLYTPAFVDDTGCTASSQCMDAGVCIQGQCATAWGTGSFRGLGVGLANAPSGDDNVRICSDNAPAGASPCGTLGYREVARATVPPGGGVVQIPVPGLADGFHTLIAEVRVAEDQPWVSSLDNPEETRRQRFVYQDLVAPVVQTLSSPSDTQAPEGVLNAAEQKAPGRVYELAIQGSEPGTAAVFVGGIQKAVVDPFDGSAVVDIPLNEGANQVYVVARDVVGNQSPVPPAAGVLYYSPVVDTVAPTLAFLTPVLVRFGDSQDVVLESDAVGRTVTVSDFGTPVGSGVVGADHRVVLPFATNPILTEGPHDLHAEVTDEAGNPASADLQTFVDTVVPDVFLAAPTHGAVFQDADDAQPAVPGFQVEVSFGGMSLDSNAWRVDLASGCDAAFTLCDPPVTVGSGTITNPGGLEPSLFVTVPAGTTPYYLFLVTVTDDVGNEASQSAGVEVQLQACQVSLGGFTPGGFINNSVCPAPGENCASVQRTLTVSVTPACGAVDEVRLFVNGSQSQQKPFQNNPETLQHTFTDGTAPALEARVYEGAALRGSSGVLSVTVDLTDPTVAFTTPPAGSSNPWGIAADEDAVAPGFQKSLTMQADDANLVGGKVTALVYAHGSGTDALAPTNLTIPYTFTSRPATLTFSRVTLADQTEGTVRVTVQDKAGNSAVSEFTATVDLLPPASPTLQVTALNPRRPAITLQWVAPGDNGDEAGTAATGYDIRYSTLPIVTTDDFETACQVTGLAYTAPVPAPAVQGTTETFTITGPDIRSPDVQENGKPCKFQTGTSGFAGYYVAIRALDDVGNASLLSSGAVASVDLALQDARFSGSGAPWNGADFQRRVYGIGDVNGDGLGDAALGGGAANAFCILYGHGAGADRTVDDLTFTAGSGADYLCIQGPANSRAGTPVVGLGDVNGDGVDDVGVGEGSASPAYPYALRVYLGRTGGITTMPNITITGMRSTAMGVVVAGQGDFDGDGVADILIGSSPDNQAFLVPGDATWTTASSVTMDLTSSADRTEHRVVTFALSGALATTAYGVNVGFVKDVDLDGYDEAAIVATADMNPSAVLVVRGRAVADAMTLTASRTNDGTGDDANVVRLQPDSNAKGGLAINALDGLWDLDGDGRGDVFAGHYYEIQSGTTNKGQYGFYGAYMASRFGQWIRVAAAPTPAADGAIYRNDKGFTIGGAYDRSIVIGNFDDDPSAAPSADLAYVLFSSVSTYGKVFLRLNLVDPQGAFGQGAFPYQAPVLVDPDNPSGTLFGRYRAVPVGDFNGDGFVDLLVGTNGAGYVVLVY